MCYLIRWYSSMTMKCGLYLPVTTTVLSPRVDVSTDVTFRLPLLPKPLHFSAFADRVRSRLSKIDLWCHCVCSTVPFASSWFNSSQNFERAGDVVSDVFACGEASSAFASNELSECGSLIICDFQ